MLAVDRNPSKNIIPTLQENDWTCSYMMHMRNSRIGWCFLVGPAKRGLFSIRKNWRETSELLNYLTRGRANAPALPSKYCILIIRTSAPVKKKEPKNAPVYPSMVPVYGTYEYAYTYGRYVSHLICIIYIYSIFGKITRPLYSQQCGSEWQTWKITVQRNVPSGPQV